LIRGDCDRKFADDRGSGAAILTYYPFSGQEGVAGEYVGKE
jgi:hypothetical protein